MSVIMVGVDFQAKLRFSMGMDDVFVCFFAKKCGISLNLAIFVPLF